MTQTPSSWIRKLDFFFVLRPTLFFPIWTFSLAGRWAQMRFMPSPHQEPLLHVAGSDLSLAIVLSIYTAMMGGVFVLNQIQDIETDRINKKLYLIANGELSVRQAWALTWILAASPLLLLLWERWDLIVVMFLSFLITGWAYSYPPLQMMKRPIGGTAVNLLAGYIVFSVGWLIDAPLSCAFFVYATPYVLGFLAVYFLTTLPDQPGDRQAGKITFAVRYGVQLTLLAAVLSALAAVIASLVTRDNVALLATALAFPFILYAWKKQSDAVVLRANKFAALILSLLVCCRFPVYLLILCSVYFLAKWYYKNRFGICYPSLQT